jgi:hypothetical protein
MSEFDSASHVASLCQALMSECISARGVLNTASHDQVAGVDGAQRSRVILNAIARLDAVVKQAEAMGFERKGSSMEVHLWGKLVRS